MNDSQGQPPAPNGGDREDDDAPGRHPPVAPKDANVADSYGKAVSDVVTGPLEGDPEKAKKPAPRPARQP